MAAREEGEGRQRHFAFGHFFEYNVRFPDLIDRLPFSFERSFIFDCSEAPTSWTFILNFKTVLGEDSVLCQIVLRRTDNSPRKVNTRFDLQPICYPLFDHLGITVERPSFECGSESRTGFSPLLPFAAVRRAPRDGVLVGVHFSVEGCHPEEMLYLKKIPEPQLPNLEHLFSKM